MIEFFSDPILKAPTLGCMFMGFCSGLMGCLVFLKKRSLIGEALSHAAYPGVVLGIILAAAFFPNSIPLFLLLGASLAALLGFGVMNMLENRLKINSDAALCFVLSLFFGVGVLCVSSLQLSHALWFRQIQVFLYGQAATMVDTHLYLYGGLTVLISLAVILLFRFIEIQYFDPEFAKTSGVPVKKVQTILTLLLVISLVIGMRSVGVVLMSAMLIAPAAGARQWTRSLPSFFLLSGIFGLTAGFCGNALSIWLPIWIGRDELSFPTGPMIVLSATTICLSSLLFAPEKGFFSRLFRKVRFQLLCQQENLLKSLYKGTFSKGNPYILWRMMRKGWLHGHALTPKGKKEAEKLIRLHRLWEVYLVHMGQHSDRVHHSAEDMEHILTPEIERHLQTLLDHPSQDPHKQPIPGVLE